MGSPHNAAEELRPFNQFAAMLARNGIDRAIANGIAMAFKQGGSKVQQRIIENLSLSHAALGVALYGDHLYGHGDGYRGRWVAA